MATINCGSSQAYVGLARASIYGTYRTDKRLADDVDVRVLVARDGANGFTGVIAVADLCHLWQSTSLRLRDSIAKALDIPPGGVGVFTTQNHSAEFDVGDEKRLDAARFDRTVVDCARQAAAAAQPVQIARVAARSKVPLNICRRVQLEGFGRFTVYYGYRVQDGQADASHVVGRALASLGRGEPEPIRTHAVGAGRAEDFGFPPPPVPVPRPLYARPADDDLVQALFFRTLDGRPVGSLLRFACHPIAANHLEMDWQSGDFPAYARRRLQAEFGGTSLYLTGPCGDQCPPVGRKSLEYARDLGKWVADVALDGLPAATWDVGGPVAAVSPEIEMRLRSDFPASPVAALAEMESIAVRIKELAGKGGPFPELQKLADHYHGLACQGKGDFYEWSGLRMDHLPRGVLRHPLFALRIGRSVIAGLPGEPFGAYSARLRRETLGEDLIVAEEANGWTSYYPTEEEWPLGGYEPFSDIFEPQTERTLLDGARSAIKALGFGPRALPDA